MLGLVHPSEENIKSGECDGEVDVEKMDQEFPEVEEINPIQYMMGNLMKKIDENKESSAEDQDRDVVEMFSDDSAPVDLSESTVEAVVEVPVSVVKTIREAQKNGVLKPLVNCVGFLGERIKPIG